VSSVTAKRQVVLNVLSSLTSTPVMQTQRDNIPVGPACAFTCSEVRKVANRNQEAGAEFTVNVGIEEGPWRVICALIRMRGTGFWTIKPHICMCLLYSVASLSYRRH